VSHDPAELGAADPAAPAAPAPLAPNPAAAPGAPLAPLAPLAPARRRRHRRHRRRRPFLLWTGLVLLLLVAAGGALAVFRYLPALGDARALRADLETMAGRVQEAGLGIDRATMDALDGDLVSATGRLDHLRDLLASDPLVALARALPPTAAHVRGADDAVAAAEDLLSAAGDGLAIGRRFVEIRETQTTGAAANPQPASDPQNASALSQIVELMATSRDRAVAAAASVARARQTLAGIPDGLAGEVESVRDAMTARIQKYGPLLDGYLSASERLPAILGWDAPRRYLVLTQNPAEVRPTGGFIGSFGIIAFDKGRITERKFQDVFLLDLPWDYPFIKGPQELHDYLLGNKQPWQLADANWSPDFPTSAQDAIRLYANESGDTNIDGVLAITTYTIDELLKVTGPVTVPQFDLTIASGQTTLKLLQAVWAAAAGGSTDRKAVLGPFADRLLASLLGLPPAKWGELLGDAETFRQGRLLQAWFRDPADQALVAGSGFDGAVRADPGDYVYPVDSNVAPTSKLNAVTTRSLDLQVQIDAVGNARNTLAATWQNRIETADGAPYRALPVVGKKLILGMYFRLLVPERSRIESVSGGSYAPLNDPAVVEAEAGRTAIGTYLRVPPGRTGLTYTWTSPYAADADQAGGTYQLTIQKQPGLLPGPLAVTIKVPTGFHITDASPGLTVRGDTATLSTTFDRDIVVEVDYTPTGTVAP
jgi:Protein of unknown function (DUF4012)